MTFKFVLGHKAWLFKIIYITRLFQGHKIQKYSCGFAYGTQKNLIN